MLFQTFLLVKTNYLIFSYMEHWNIAWKSVKNSQVLSTLYLLSVISVLYQWLVRKKIVTAQKMRFSIPDFFSKCDQTCSFLWIWAHLLKKSLMENFSFCAVCIGFLYAWYLEKATLQQYHCYLHVSYLYIADPFLSFITDPIYSVTILILLSE